MGEFTRRAISPHIVLLSFLQGCICRVEEKQDCNSLDRILFHCQNDIPLVHIIIYDMDSNWFTYKINYVNAPIALPKAEHVVLGDP